MNVRGVDITLHDFPARDWLIDECESGRWEPDTFDAIDAYCKDGGCLVDIGAHVGIFSIYAAKKYRSPVVAFEPDPVAWKVLGQNLMSNQAWSVMRHPYAIWVYDGAVELHIQGELGDSMTGVSRGGEAVTVAAMAPATARLLCPDDIALTKVDIEGAEGTIWPQLDESFGTPMHIAWHDQEAAMPAPFPEQYQTGNFNTPYPQFLLP